MALVFIVEDDNNISEIETIALKNSNYQVSTYECANELYRALEGVIPDLILLDVMLPDEDGFTIVKKIRSNLRTRSIPIIMITAKSTEMDLVRGLDVGADDYIKKPFSIMELLSRVKALLRRTTDMEVQTIQNGSIVLNHDEHVVTVAGEPIELTYKEYELLRHLMTNAGIVLSRDKIMRLVWDTDFEGESRTVDMHIKTLRHKLGEDRKLIRTVRNVGYVMDKKA